MIGGERDVGASRWFAEGGKGWMERSKADEVAENGREASHTRQVRSGLELNTPICRRRSEALGVDEARSICGHAHEGMPKIFMAAVHGVMVDDDRNVRHLAR